MSMINTQNSRVGSVHICTVMALYALDMSEFNVSTSSKVRVYQIVNKKYFISRMEKDIM